MVIDENIASVGHQRLTVDCFGFCLNISENPTGNFVLFKYKRMGMKCVIIAVANMTLSKRKNAIALSHDSPVLILRSEVDDKNYTDGSLAFIEKQSLTRLC